MQRGNFNAKKFGPRSWLKCSQCGKIVKGERKMQAHYSKAKH